MNKQILSRLEDAITVFGRFLRQAGYSVGAGEIMQAVQAVNYIKIEKREDFRQALKTCLLSNYKLIPLFDQLFEIYWRNPDKIENVSNILKRLNEPRIDFEKKNLIKENIEDIFKKQFSETNIPNQESYKSDKVNIHLYSPFEQLKNKRFDHYSDEELEIGFNARYLQELTSQVDGERVEFSFRSSGDPALMRDVDDSGAMYVVMPMRV